MGNNMAYSRLQATGLVYANAEGRGGGGGGGDS
jgi:hypothetical protein